MRLLNQEDLKLYTETEIWDFYRYLMLLLPTLRDGSLDQLNVLMNLQIVRACLSERYRLRPG